jgi:hypothetical protein
LSLWSKHHLSTVRQPFTIYYQYKYLSKLTNTKKPLRVEKPGQAAASRVNTPRRKSLSAGRTGRHAPPENDDREKQTQQGEAIALPAKAKAGTARPF